MSRINELLHDDAAKVAEILHGDSCPDDTIGLIDIRAALTNALRCIARLEDRLDLQSTAILRLERSARSSFEH